MARRYILKDEELLTPEVIRAILAKELLLRQAGSRMTAPGNLITTTGGAYLFHFEFTDSAQAADDDDTLMMMLASEDVLRDEWDTPEEDEAWADLLKVK
jgi:hypothetical protein